MGIPDLRYFTIIVMASIICHGAARPAPAATEPDQFDQMPVDPDYAHASAEAFEKFADLKFGMRIVWGQNTVLGLNWDGAMRKGGCSEEFRKIYLTQYQLMDAPKFDADEWANLCVRAGMRYALTTTKMHCGFCLWPTQTTTPAYRRSPRPSPGSITVEEAEMHYSIMDTPLKRDVIKELFEALRKKGLPVGIHFSHVDWNDPRFRWDYNNRYFGKEFKGPLSPQSWTEQHRRQILELAGNYGPLLQISFDTGGIPLPKESFPEIAKTVKMVRKLQPDCLFRSRGIGSYGDYDTPEGWVPKDVAGKHERVWEHIDFLAGIWGYWPGDNLWKSKEWLVSSLVDSVSKGGNFMPSVSPMPNGQFPPQVVERLEYVGDWLKVNGEAIYKTRPWTQWKEGNDIRFTRSKDNKYVYAIALKWPGKTLTLKSVQPRKDSKITILGVAEPLDWRMTDGGLAVELPAALQDEANRPCKQCYSLKIEIAPPH